MSKQPDRKRGRVPFFENDKSAPVNKRMFASPSLPLTLNLHPFKHHEQINATSYQAQMVGTYTFRFSQPFIKPAITKKFQQFPNIGDDLSAGFPQQYVEFNREEHNKQTRTAFQLFVADYLKENKKQPHFITFRNNLNKIMATSLSQRDAWKINAIKINNTVFLDVVENGKQEENEENKKFMYMGYKVGYFFKLLFNNELPLSLNSCARVVVKRQ